MCGHCRHRTTSCLYLKMCPKRDLSITLVQLRPHAALPVPSTSTIIHTCTHLRTRFVTPQLLHTCTAVAPIVSCLAGCRLQLTLVFFIASCKSVKKHNKAWKGTALNGFPIHLNSAVLGSCMGVSVKNWNLTLIDIEEVEINKVRLVLQCWRSAKKRHPVHCTCSDRATWFPDSGLLK